MIEPDLVNRAMLFFAGGTLAAIGACVVFLMPLKFRVVVMAVLAVPQVMLPGLPESASIFQVWVILCGVVFLIRERPNFFSVYGKMIGAMIGAMICVVVFAALWSPEPSLSAIAALQILSLLLIAMQVAYLARTELRSFSLVLRWLSIGVLVQSIMVVAFRISPALESDFLHSQAARILIGADKMSNFFFGSRDNVYDPIKAGGFWVNANTGSLFLGVAGCIFMLAGLRFRSKWFYLTALVAGSGVAFSGSKTGMVLLLVLPAAAVLVPTLLRPAGRAWLLPAACAAWPVSLMVARVADALVPESLVADSASTLSTREVIWGTASLLFKEHPVTGLGFGGWSQEFISASGAALGRYFPPHNIFIAAWADAGLLFAILLAAFFTVVLFGLMRLAARTPTPRESYAWGFAFAGMAWLLLHGQADAVSFYGDLRTLFLPGIVLGLLMNYRSEPLDRAIQEAAHPRRLRRRIVRELDIKAG